MGRTFKGVLSGLFDQSVHLRDSRHAAENFGFNKAYLGHGTPRHKFQFFVAFRFNSDPEVKAFVDRFLDRDDQQFITAMVKTVDMPSVNISTETLNQYNRKRISQTQLEYQPINLVMHDTVEGKPLRLWEMYYEYYFRDGVASEKLANSRTRNTDQYPNQWTDKFLDNHGYNIQRVGNHKHLFDALSIYQVHGGHFSRTELVFPRINSFRHDTLDYAAGGELMQIQMELGYEGLIYANVNEPLDSDELQRYIGGDFWEMANLITFRTQVPGRDIRSQAPFPSLTSLNARSPDGSDSDQSPARTAAERLIGRTGSRAVARVQGTLGGIVDGIPDAIGSAVSTTIFGGTISLSPDPVKAIKTSVNQGSREVVGAARRNLASTVTGAVVGIFNRPEEEGEDNGEDNGNGG